MLLRGQLLLYEGGNPSVILLASEACRASDTYLIGASVASGSHYL